MKSSKDDTYLLQNDKQLFDNINELLSRDGINSFDELTINLKKLKIKSLTELWDYTSSSKCSEDLAISFESLIKRIKRLNKERLEAFCSSSQVGYYLVNKLCGSDQEQLFAIYLDSKNKVIAEKEIFKGTLNKSIVHPRDVFRWALIYNCASFFIAHNHPSGDCTPSKQDLITTKKIKAASKFMGIEFLDHFIVSDSNYTSLREAELI